MKELTTTNSPIKIIVDDEDFERLQKFKYHNANKKNPIIYRCENRNYRVRHYSIANDVMQTIGVIYDHIDRNPFNNQKSNLRRCNMSQNGCNRLKKLNCSSKYKGVYWLKTKRKWCAGIKINKQRKYIGLFEIEEDAAKAYDKKALEVYKEFAVLNFPL